jgi:hypothetical protein
MTAPAERRLWSPLPTQAQQALLRLALSPSVDAAHVEAWTRQVDIRQLDEGSARLMPSLYLRLSAAGIAHPWLATMRGWYRRSLYRNRLLIHRGLDLVRRLDEQGISSLLLKGCPLGTRYYANLGERPMGDFDLLLAEATPAAKVEAILMASGGMTLRNRSLHAHTFADRDGFEYDVHWHLQQELAFPGSSQPFWDRAESIVIEGESFRTLSAEDHVFHVLAHGLKVSDVPPLRWIVDVAAIVRSTPEFDWSRLLEQAARTATALPVAAGLAFMVQAALLDGTAEETLQRLGALRQRTADRILFGGQMRRPSLVYSSLRPFLLYRRLARLSSGAAPGPDFARFLATLWDLDDPRRIPAAALGKLGARLRARAPA